jgi:hypothetical protein
VTIRYVRFTPESGHVQRRNRCPLCAISGHETPSLLISLNTSSDLLQPKRTRASRDDADHAEMSAAERRLPTSAISLSPSIGRKS